MLEKTYQPAAIEPRVTADWDKAQAFKAGRPGSEGKPPYSIVIPPPNVTGSLHMGHAVNNTLQDVLCRFERMRGKDVLWQPGTDHAGIATQMVVERQLALSQQPGRRDLGREKFLEKVWSWKAESGGTITNQLKRLGASCDWSRERFTMGANGGPDDQMVRAVTKVFVELYRDGLIYKDKRLVNWDPKFQTAISDLEVVQIEKRGSFTWVSGDAENPFDAAALAKVLDRDPSGHMYYFRYPLADGMTFEMPVEFDADKKPVRFETRNYIVVATTRPETILGDTGVAVHPEDARYAGLVAAKATITLPLVGRLIPIVADEFSDPEKGTGAVKITPAHDFNDFEVGKRQGLDKINVMDAFGAIGGDAPEIYRGLDRFEARKRVVAELEALDLLEKIEPTTQMLPHGDRSGVPIEPWLTDQWYMNAGELAKPAMAAIESGATQFVPKNWEKTYFEWMNNIQPWCISRQLWWGHQIPAWYGPDGEFFVAMDEVEAAKLARAHYNKDVALKRDEDVLDTWFSSALWPFSTLGWPDETAELARYYPTSVLVTGFDIIFFWVARMMMMGLYFQKQVPFKDIYIHALVRDGQGHKMSKSKGNVLDPLDIIDGIGLEALITKRTTGLMKPEDAPRIAKDTRKEFPNGIPAYGTDALRFTLARMAAQGRDIKLSLPVIEGNRNFATKLWNAARFAEMNECVRQRDFDPKKVTNTLNRWIAGETERAAKAVTAGIEGYKFNEASGAVYEFVWGVFCDWYLELIKPILMGDDEASKAETRATVAWVLDQILKLLHPFMPFITEELWAHMVEHGEARQNLLTLSEWPKLSGLADAKVDEEIAWVIAFVEEVRSVRQEMNVPAGLKVPLEVSGASLATRNWIRDHEDTLKRLARADSVIVAKTPPKGAALMVVGEATIALPLEGVIDMGAERKRLEKEIAKAESDKSKAESWLGNEANVANSPPQVLELNRERVAEGAEKIKRLKAALKRIET